MSWPSAPTGPLERSWRSGKKKILCVSQDRGENVIRVLRLVCEQDCTDWVGRLRPQTQAKNRCQSVRCVRGEQKLRQKKAGVNHGVDRVGVACRLSRGMSQTD